jgi:hypothetical protein
MTARRETKGEHFRDTLRFAMRPGWKLLPLILALAVVGYLLVQQAKMKADRPVETRDGRIVRFGVQPDPRSHEPSSVAVVRFADGTTSEVYGRPDQMAQCHVGDRMTWTRGPQGTQIDRCTP